MFTISDFQEVCSFYRSLDRSFFLDNEYKEFAHYDQALPIGLGQTISQPSLVVEMTIELDLTKDNRVLEIGTGSGYQTAFLAEFGGQVYTVERLEDLSSKARKRLKDLGYNNISYRVGDGSEGWEEVAPFDRIIATAGAGKFPEKLVEQLKPGGKMLVPVGEKGAQELILLEKDENSKVIKESLGRVQFVEFKGKYGWN